MKNTKLFKLFIFVLSYCIWSIHTVLADAPVINCYWLPGCEDKKSHAPSPANIDKDVFWDLIWNLIQMLIQYVPVVAVVALTLSGIMYMLSGGDDEKVKKAKNWITWSLVWVIFSLSAWSIVNILNTL